VPREVAPVFDDATYQRLAWPCALGAPRAEELPGRANQKARPGFWYRHTMGCKVLTVSPSNSSGSRILDRIVKC
jgi:hypothetical protein